MVCYGGGGDGVWFWKIFLGIRFLIFIEVICVGRVCGRLRFSSNLKFLWFVVLIYVFFLGKD